MISTGGALLLQEDGRLGRAAVTSPECASSTGMRAPRGSALVGSIKDVVLARLRRQAQSRRLLAGRATGRHTHVLVTQRRKLTLYADNLASSHHGALVQSRSIDSRKKQTPANQTQLVSQRTTRRTKAGPAKGNLKEDQRCGCHRRTAISGQI